MRRIVMIYKMKNKLLVTILNILILTFSGCCKNNVGYETIGFDDSMDLEEVNEVINQETDNLGEGINEVRQIDVLVNEIHFTATLEDNEATKELVELLQNDSIALYLSDYAGFEKVGELGHTLTTSNHQTTTKSGDIVLYNGNQIVMFYGSNSWSYTYLAHIDDLNGWEEALGNGDVTVILSIQ